MRLGKLWMTFLLVLMAPWAVKSSTGSGTVTGKVTYVGTPAKAEPIDMSKDPACVKLHAQPLLTEKAVTGPGNTLGNVVVYISAGADDAPAQEMSEAHFDQQGCRYTPHVLAVRVGQPIRFSNNDPLSHNIHTLAKVNREWNRIQPAQTPAFSYAYDKEEFIPVKCNVHPWMLGYIAALKSSHFAVTREDGTYTLPELPPGKYTVTAWHELYGTQSREITITGSETQTVNFLFYAKP
ncbi:MAG: carboxypeptidase regulatory-like domain-containing protein [Candidatus Acidiferrum sp.]